MKIANFIKNTFFYFPILFYGSCYTNTQVNRAKLNTDKIIDFEIDKIGNQYTIYDNGDIYKSVSDQKYINNCNFNNLGKLYALDVTNPQKILAFYKDFQTIIILDNSLSELSRIKFNSDQYISGIGLSNTGDIWIYDSVKKKIYEINNDNLIQEESLTILSPIPDDIVENKLIERENNLYIIDKLNGIIIFNNLLSFDNQYHLINISKPAFTKNQVWYFDKTKNKIYSFDFKLQETIEIFDFKSLDISPITALISENKVFYLLDDQINFISLKK